MTNIEKLKTWAENAVKNLGLIDVKFFPNETSIRDKTQELEYTADEALQLLEGNEEEQDITDINL